MPPPDAALTVRASRSSCICFKRPCICCACCRIFMISAIDTALPHQAEWRGRKAIWKESVQQFKVESVDSGPEHRIAFPKRRHFLLFDLFLSHATNTAGCWRTVGARDHDPFDPGVEALN